MRTAHRSHTALSPQVKICGLTQEKEALACAELGASAIGCVFYPPSPRCVSEEQARSICRSLPQNVHGVGVFVNETFSGIMRKVERCSLKAVQLHGREPVELAERLLEQGIVVIKAFFLKGAPGIEDAFSYRASACLVECAGGKLPGGNALSWDWSAAAGVGEVQPLILAGGLDPENVARAMQAAAPDALDVSSGVEARPGRKDIDKVKRFMEAVFKHGCSRKPRRIFR